MDSIKRRLEALERELSTASITLTMKDGSIFRIPADGSTIISAAGAALNGDPDPIGQAILEAVSDDEEAVTGGGHLCECFRALDGIAFQLTDGDLVSIRRHERPALRAAVLALARGETSGNDYDAMAAKLSEYDRNLLIKSEAPNEQI